jgi:thiamine kinase-like enzyme
MKHLFVLTFFLTVLFGTYSSAQEPVKQNSQDKIGTNISLSLNDLLTDISKNYACPIKEAIKKIAPTKNVNDICFHPLLGGLSSAKLFSIDIDDKKYVFKLLDETISIERRKSEINAHKIGAELNIAPKLLFSDEVPLIMVMEFIEGRHFAVSDLNNKEIIAKIFQALRKFNYYSGEKSIIHGSRIKSLQDLYDYCKKNDVVFPSCFVRLFTKLQTDYANLHAEQLPTHGDLNPENILITTTGDVYLIDWADASIDNPLLDVGWMACLSAANNDQIENLLKGYLGRNPTASEKKETLFFRDLTLFFVAIIWLGKQPLKNQNELDAILSGPLKRGSERITEGLTKEEIRKKKGLAVTVHALEWLKEFIENQDLGFSENIRPRVD